MTNLLILILIICKVTNNNNMYHQNYLKVMTSNINFITKMICKNIFYINDDINLIWLIMLLSINMTNGDI